MKIAIDGYKYKYMNSYMDEMRWLSPTPHRFNVMTFSVGFITCMAEQPSSKRISTIEEQ